MSLNVYEIITDRIIQSLQANVVPWRTPWKSVAPANLISRKPYRGVNVFLLSASRHTSPYWVTYNQCKERGGQVKRGERSTPIIFWKIFADKVVAGNKERGGAILRYYNVFNVAQCDGLDVPVSDIEDKPFSPIDEAESLLSSYTRGPSVVHGGNRACYSPTLDQISMPVRESFTSPEEYYSTLFHEEVHGTGAKTRLDREGITNPIKFGSHNYSVEELIAEMGASFLAGQCGILDTTFDNSAAYIGSWVSKLQSNPKWVVQAGGSASKAADYILGRDLRMSDIEEEEAE